MHSSTTVANLVMCSIPVVSLNTPIFHSSSPVVHSSSLKKDFHSSVLSMTFIIQITYQCIADTPQDLDPETNSHLQDSIPWQYSHQ